MYFGRKIISISLLAILLLLGLFLYKNKEADIDVSSLPIKTMQASFVYDTTDIQESVGMVDYVFVGKVLSNDGTEYKNVKIMEDETDGLKRVGTPYTDYTVQVIENIKGELQTDSPICIIKHGGIAIDKKSVTVFENDELPEVDETYIFLAYSQEDGSLLVSGPFSNIKTSTDSNSVSTQSMQEDSLVEKYKDAYENEVVPIERERTMSSYDKNAID